MVDSPEHIPFEKRKSQNLTFKDYAKDTLLWAALPLIAGAATFIGGRISRNHFNNKIWPLDGSPTLIQTLWEKAFSHVGKNVGAGEVVLGEVERLAPFNNFIPEEHRLNATRDFWNFAKGTELALFPTAFHLWRREERTRLNLKPAHDRLKAISDVNPTNDDLAADNALMKKQLDHIHVQRRDGVETPGTKLSTDSVEHDGKMTDAVELQR